MDIAKIRKKAKADGLRQEQTPEAGRETRTEAPGPEQSAVPGPDLSADLPGASAEPRSAQAPAPEESRAGASDGDQAVPGVPAATDPPGAGGSDRYAAAEKNEGSIAELLTFSLAKEEFAFKVSEVEEIIRFQRITLVPTMPAYVSGITSLRGKIIPVIDLRTRLALKDDDGEVVTRPEANADGLIEGKGKIIVLAGPLGLIGAIIDKVLGVVRLPEDVILEPPAHLTEDETRFIEGVVIVEKRFISIIRSEDALNIEVD